MKTRKDEMLENMVASQATLLITVLGVICVLKLYIMLS